MTARTDPAPLWMPAAIRTYWDSLTGAQFKLLVFLSDLSGTESRWVEISITEMCGTLKLRRQTTINALRALHACGLIERSAPALRARHRYRLNPAIPDRNPNLITGRMQREQLVAKTYQSEVVAFSDHAGTIFVPLGVQTEEFSGAHKEVIDIQSTKDGCCCSDAPEKQQQQPRKRTSKKDHPKLPETTARVREHFPDADPNFFRELWERSLEAFNSVPDELRVTGADSLLDEYIAHAVETCRKPHQRGAGLYLKTVPACIAAWVAGAQK